MGELKAAEHLRDWPDPRYTLQVLSKLPAPRNPETGDPLWESGMRLHGNQQRVMFEDWRFKLICGGWRWGKSFIAALAVLVDYLWRSGERGMDAELWGIVGDTYSMAEEEMRHLHQMLADLDIPHEMRMPERQSWKISFPHNRCEITTLTAADVTKIASRAYRGMVIAEAAQTTFEAFTNARGRVMQTRGWVLLEGTLEEAKSPWYASLAREWMKPGTLGVYYAGPSWENEVLYPGGRRDPEILSMEENWSPSLFGEKIAGVPQKLRGVVFPEAEERWLVRDRYPSLGISFDPELPVYLAIDPGLAHAYAVLAIQVMRNQVWVIDAVYRWGREARLMIEECVARPWAANVQEAVMDFAGRQERSEGPSNLRQWQQGWRELMDMPLAIHANPVPLATGYEAHRRALLNSWPEDEAMRTFNDDRRAIRITNPDGPRLMFAPDAAAPLFGGMVDGQKWDGEYRLHHNRQDRNGVVISNEPVDTSNDAIKALNYFLVWYFGVGQRPRVEQLGGFRSVPWEFVLAS